MMESEQPEASASNLIDLDDEALYPSMDEESKSATDVESDLIGGEVDGSSSVHTEPTTSHEQVDQEHLIKFKTSSQDVHDILQPQTVKIGSEEGSAEGEIRQDRGNAAFGEHINISAASDEQIPQRVSIDDEWGSPQKRLRYETDGTGFGTHDNDDDDGDDDDDDDDDDNGHGTRYVLKPQEICIHVGADTNLRFGVQDNNVDDDDNRYISESQNDAQIVEHKSPELQFEQEEEEEEDDDDDDDRDDDRYILQPQNVAPDVLESPALQFEDDDDGDVADEDRYIRHFQPSATDAEQKPLELQFETGDDDDNRYLPQSQTAYSVKQEMNLENKDEKIDLRFILQSENVAEDDTEQVSPELQFEPDEEGGDDDEDENRYNRLFQPVALETDVMVMQESPELQFEPDDEDEDSDDDHKNRYNRLAPETDVMVKQESPELQYLSDNVAVDVDDDNDVDADDGNRYIASPTGYDEPGHSVAYEQQFHDTSAASAVATADDEDDDDNDDDGALDLHPRDIVSETSAGGQEGLDLQYGLYSRSVGTDGGDDGDNDDNDDDDALDLHPRDIASESSAGGQEGLELQYGLYAPSLGADVDGDDYGGSYGIPTVGSEDYEQPEADQYQRGSYPAEEDEGDERYVTPSRSEEQENTAGGEYDSQEQQHQRGYYASSHYDGQEGDNKYIAPENAVDYEQPSPELQYQHGIYDEDGDNDGSSRDVDFEQGYQEDHHRHGDHAVYEAEGENDEYDNGYFGLSIHAAQNEQQHQQSLKDSLGGANDDEDDNGRYTMTPTNNEFQYDQITRESQQRLEPYYEGDDVDDNGINDNPRLLIKGILSEGSVDETHGANVCEEDDDDDDDDDTGDAIDIRDNTNVEDQFIEFEENSFVEAAVSNVISDENFSGEKEASKEESVGDGNGANEETPEAGAVGGGGANHVKNDGVAGTSSSRVTFADEIDLRREHRYRHYHDGDGDGDDYHIIPGLYKQGSHDSDDRNYSEEGEKSLDVLLLEEICEEAASMTIKEALIHSLKPNVRAGLTTAHLKLSESEVLALEGYCEEFVGGLIKDLLKRSSLLDLASGAKQTVVKASVIKSTAKQLSAMEVQQLKLYCDHFVHNVIAESIIDSSMIVARQQHQAEQVKELLHMFQNSEELQEYFTNLTTDIVRAALLNVTAKDEMEADNQEDEETKSRECEIAQSMEQRNYRVPDQDFENQDDDFDFDSTPSFGYPLRDDGSSEYRSSRSQEFWPSEDEGEMGTRQSERTTAKYAGRSPHGNTSLEFDEEWAEGVIQNIGAFTDGEKRQKIVMRELDFDDRANVGGTELLAPVFLAVAEDNEDDTEFEGLRRRTQSIEDLCDLIEEEKEPPRKRASSLTQPKRKPRKKPRPSSYHEQMEELKREAIHEDTAQNTSEPLSLQLYAEPEVSQSMSPDTPSSPKTSSEKSFYAYDDERYRWHTIRVNNREKVLDLKLIEPYMKVITHGGVHTPSRAVIVVIAACYLPDKTKRNYEFLMEQLFFYLISTLELLATTDEYFLVYFNGGSTQSNQPALPWMRRFYQHIEGGLKKHMINMFIVHPNFWLKTVVRFAKAFVGTNFWSKLQFIKSLDELSTKIPVEFIYVPDEVIRCDPKYKRVHNL